VKMKIIGLTGGIGSGKSTVARFLGELGAVVTDLDKVGHDVLKKGGEAYQKVVSGFGEGILNEDGEIDRRKLGKIVFHDREALKRLNQIVHPVIDNKVKKITQESRKKGIKVVVLEAAAMLENERRWKVDEIWVTVAPEQAVLGRLKERSGYSEAEARTRILSQMKNKERVKKADVVIDTGGTLDELKARVKAEWEKLLERL
jgi:dephospho-CoA kinase